MRAAVLEQLPFIFEKTMFMFGILKQEKTSLSMAKSLDDLENTLGHDLYRKYFSLILGLQ